MTLIVAGEKADAVLRWLRRQKQPAWCVGEVVPGGGVVKLV